MTPGPGAAEHPLNGDAHHTAPSAVPASPLVTVPAVTVSLDKAPCPPPERSEETSWLRRLRLVAVRLAIGLVAFLVVGNLALYLLTVWARHELDEGPPVEVSGVDNLRAVDDHLWRGAHPSPEGFAELAALGVTTVVDLRAEPGAHVDEALMADLGLTVYRIPIRDGQTPTSSEVERFLTIAHDTPGRVFVHCGAGVGRTGTVSAAYLVATGQAGRAEALARNLAVGPPSLEQVMYAIDLEAGEWEQPNAVVRGVSRVLDAPRRGMSVMADLDLDLL